MKKNENEGVKIQTPQQSNPGSQKGVQNNADNVGTGNLAKGVPKKK